MNNLTLSDIEWDALELRRCDLLGIRLEKGKRTLQEDVEFSALQKLMALRRKPESDRFLKSVKRKISSLRKKDAKRK